MPNGATFEGELDRGMPVSRGVVRPSDRSGRESDPPGDHRPATGSRQDRTLGVRPKAEHPKCFPTGYLLQCP